MSIVGDEKMSDENLEVGTVVVILEEKDDDHVLVVDQSKRQYVVRKAQLKGMQMFVSSLPKDCY